ncbi:MerR family transcriptional regulator [Paenibacillus sp. P96]|uniref:MerR family transcriptional regulator n=1 Tax=Paenibacillus zeirhizosphaerae TaxID=2987519 RepID=A0ABT9FLU6_9BACL|nr:MerR family transcriptional regulator [Paenibacillus sp. P96]MDP4095695.1 MerR family transcriptional regulator [Paenibacillus sp. P96]
MQRMSTEYFTTSELARTCGVTKHTLFHYDEIGLLKPEFVNSNGYRYYSLRQCYVLDIINVLKKAGSSLQEIKGFIQNQNTPLFIELLKEKQQALEVERIRIKRMQSLLKDAIEMTELAKGELYDRPSMEECEEEYFIVTRLEQGDGDPEFAHKLTEHRNYCENHFIDYEFPIWTILSKDRLESEDYYPDYIANKLKTQVWGEKQISKPKGLYAVVNHRGSYETMSETYSLLKRFIKDNGMAVGGNAYTVDLLSYFTEKNPNDYVIQISVEVSRV